MLNSSKVQALDDIVSVFRSHTFAESTKKTYRVYLNSYCTFCLDMGIPFVPLSPINLARYIAALSKTLKFNSIQNYLTIIRLLHKEADKPCPLDSHYIQGVLKGAKRMLGDLQTCKLPITPQILLGIFKTINLNSSFDVSFWAASLVAFFSFFRKSNLFVPSINIFDPDRHLSRQAVSFQTDGVLLTIRKTKTIQNGERVLLIPLPRILGSPLCPAQALLLLFKMVRCTAPVCPAFLFQSKGKTLPLTYKNFLTRLQHSLSQLGFDCSQYSGHSFRRGGASFALECGVPAELIQAQGDWKSDAYKRYLDPSIQHRKTVMHTFAQALGRKQ
jgi:hypothetical protein